MYDPPGAAAVTPADVPPGRPYHHGNLRQALADAGLELARTGGPDAVVLRAVSRLAGVSHSAGYRHFSEREDLLREVGRRCALELAAHMQQRLKEAGDGDTVGEAWGRLAALGGAYVEFALTEPGWFRTGMAAAPVLSPGRLDLRIEGEAGPFTQTPDDPLKALSRVLDELVAKGVLPPERRPGAEFAAWSMVHGLSTLLVDGPLRGSPDELVEEALWAALGVVSRGL